MKRTILLVLSLLLAAVMITSCGQEPKVNPEPEPGPTSYGVFMVGETKYRSLQKAVNAVKNAKGSAPTITLLGDVEDGGAEIDTDVILDFGSYTYTLKNSDSGIIVNTGKTVSVSGGVFKAASNNTATSLFVSEGGNFTLSNVSVNLPDTNLNAIKATTGATTTINGKSSIVVSDDKKIIEATNSSATVAPDAEVSLKGSFSVNGASIDLSNSKLCITSPIDTEGDSWSIKVGNETATSTSIITPEISTEPDSSKSLFFAAVDGTIVDVGCDVTNTAFVTYQWYSNTTGSNTGGTLITGANERTLNEKIAQKGLNNYFYCVVNNAFDDTKTDTSHVVQVYYTGLPTVYVDLNTTDDVFTEYTYVFGSSNPDEKGYPDSKYPGTYYRINGTQKIYNKDKDKKYKDATVTISGAENDDWNVMFESVTFSGRGNSTWRRPKKPFKLKLAAESQVMGMPKHENWVLLSNYQDNTHMRNSLAFYLSETLEMDYTVKGYFVDLVLNGEYMGLYWLGEQIKEGGDRGVVNDDEYLLELDTYFDEAYMFLSKYRGLPYMVKNDKSVKKDTSKLYGLKDIIDALEIQLYPGDSQIYSDDNQKVFIDNEDVQEAIATEAKTVRDGKVSTTSAPNEDYAEILDVTSWAKMYLVNKLMDNVEVAHPKSVYLVFDTVNNKLKAGPVWDYDWGCLDITNWKKDTEHHNYNGTEDTVYYNALFKSPAFISALKSVWNEYKNKIDTNAKVEEYRSELSVAQELDVAKWHPIVESGNIDAPHSKVNARNSYDAYTDAVKEKLNTKMEEVNSFINGLSTTSN